MKQQLREEMLQKRSRMSQDEWREKSNRILEGLLNSEKYKRAKRIFTFVSVKNEVDTRDLISQAWKDGKEVFVPIAKRATGMYFVKIDTFDELFENKFGVFEPKREKADESSPTAEDFFVVPGAVFDLDGNRIGYGGGYYDRYFAEHIEIERIAVAFAFQVLENKLEMEAYDIAVDKIMTEKGELLC